MPFQVFIKLDSNGQKTVTIQGLEPEDTIGTLVQKLVDKEALEKDNITLVFRGKQLSDKSKKLKEVGLRARSILFVAFTVIGGMAAMDPGEFEDEGITTVKKNNDTEPDAGDGNSNVRRYNKEEAKKYGIKVSKQKCMVGLSDACDMKSISKLEFKECNHPYCSDCVFEHLKNSINRNAKTEIKCADSGCGKSFDIDATFVAAALKPAEIESFETQLNKNCLTVICPNDKCKAYLIMDHISVNKIQCTKCHGDWFCKICNIKWPANSGSEYVICGNMDCSSSAKIFEELLNCERKDFGIEKDVPTLRICIKCRSFVKWEKDCKHATCSIKTCEYKFCFVCLKEGHSCPLGQACKVQEQEYLYV